MGRKFACDRELVLDAFARGRRLKEISGLVGGVPLGTLGAIVHRARRAGDPRALRWRRNDRASLQTVHGQPQPTSESALVRRLRLGRAFPSSPEELKAATARSRVPVRRVRPGVASAGWRPSWLNI